MILKGNEKKTKINLFEKDHAGRITNRFEGKIRQRPISKPTGIIIQAREDQSQNECTNLKGWIDMVKYYIPSLW